MKRSSVIVGSILLASAAHADPVTKYVSKDCANLLPAVSTTSPVLCFDTVQECVADLESSNPNDGRNCIIYPGIYEEEVVATLSTGTTNLIGFGSPRDSINVIPVRIKAPSDEQGGTVTLTLAHGSVSNIAVQAGVEDTDVAFRTPASGIGFVEVLDCFFDKPSGSELQAGGHLVEFLHTSGVLFWKNSDIEEICGASADSATAFVYVQTDAGGSGYSEIRNSQFTINATGCNANSALVEVASGILKVLNSQLTGGRRMSVFEIASEGAALETQYVALQANGTTQANQGRLFRVTGAGTSSTVKLRAIRQAQGLVGTNVWGNVVPTGDAHWSGAGSPVSLAPVNPCFNGWTYTNESGGSSSTFWVCEAGTWTAK